MAESEKPWVLVPREPTEAMLAVVHPSWRAELAANYRAMISASPAPEGGEEGSSGAESAADRGPCPSAPPAQHSAGWEPDELTEAEIERRAKGVLLASGWRPGDKLSAWSAVRLMVALGLDLTRMPATDRCSHPSCECDFDAVCDAALSHPHHSGGRS